MSRLRSFGFFVLSLFAPAALVACEERTPPPATRSAVLRTVPELPRVRLELAESAYGPQLFVEGDEIVLLTSSAVHWLTPDRPPEHYDIALGSTRTLTEGGIVFWSEAGFFRTPRHGGTPEKIGDAPFEPHALASVGERFAWTERAPSGSFRVQVLDGGKPRALHESAAELVALTLLGDAAYFVERSPRGWRLGSVPLAGGEPRFSEPRGGRAPSLLRSTDQIYYYDGSARSVHRTSPDFASDELIGKQLVCSPLALAATAKGTRSFCARVGGIDELQLNSAAARPLVSEARGPVTALAAGPRLVAWLRDSGENRLSLSSLALPER